MNQSLESGIIQRRGEVVHGSQVPGEKIGLFLIARGYYGAWNCRASFPENAQQQQPVDSRCSVSDYEIKVFFGNGKQRLNKTSACVHGASVLCQQHIEHKAQIQIGFQQQYCLVCETAADRRWYV